MHYALHISLFVIVSLGSSTTYTVGFTSLIAPSGTKQVSRNALGVSQQNQKAYILGASYFAYDKQSFQGGHTSDATKVTFYSCEGTALEIFDANTYSPKKLEGFLDTNAPAPMPVKWNDFYWHGAVIFYWQNIPLIGQWFKDKQPVIEGAPGHFVQFMDGNNNIIKAVRIETEPTRELVLQLCQAAGLDTRNLELMLPKKPIREAIEQEQV